VLVVVVVVVVVDHVQPHIQADWVVNDVQDVFAHEVPVQVQQVPAEAQAD